MLLFKNGQVPGYEFKKAIKKPIPIRCIQIQEPFTVETKEGILNGNAGDYLMVGIKGEMYPCDREIFEETYDIISCPLEEK
jgi:hypothetical protein